MESMIHLAAHIVQPQTKKKQEKKEGEEGEEAKASQRHTVGCFQLQRRKRIWLELKAAHPHPEMGSFSSYRRLSAVVW